MVDANALLIEGFNRHRAGEFGKAASIYRRVLTLEPGECNALNLLGVIERRIGATEAGIVLIRRSIRTNPHFPDAQQNLANALLAAERYAEAVAPLEILVRERPDWAEGRYLLGGCLIKTNRRSEAAAPLRAALAADPGNMAWRGALGEALLSRVETFEEALRHFKVMVAMQPDGIEGMFGVANAQSELGAFAQSVAACERTLRIDPDYAKARHIIGVNLCSMGRWTDGLAAMEWRANNLHFASLSAKSPLWDGHPLPNGDLVVLAEGGFGDMIQFVRFVPDAAQRCRQVHVVAPAPLARLLGTLSPPSANVAFTNRPPFPTARILMMSLPRALGLGVEDLGRRTSYLAADPALVGIWSARLGPEDPRLRIGVFWNNGSDGRPADPRRSAPYPLIRRLAAVPGVRLVNLHKPDRMTRALVPEGDAGLLHDPGHGFDDGPDAFQDSAAVLMNLDLIISIDSAIVHLAGALGRPTWLLHCHRQDWRWMGASDSTAWYPTVRIFRQSTLGDWEGVFDRVGADLARLAEAAARSRPEKPAGTSWPLDAKGRPV